ncbi:hypothetical protein B296_00028001 [Ensete ventricosum]|uniref:Remorin C-terminal domain-containing protein n=1 Tax=Ensete ventricosum TaxID=4639 RepID=A0A426YV34_ENSVE|nr:hypothetical protein B296_00028001 [Ensete ventricosum]
MFSSLTRPDCRATKVVVRTDMLRLTGRDDVVTQQHLENKKAESKETIKNKIAMVHKTAEEKRAMVEAKRGEELLKVEEAAAKYRATGKPPNKKKGFGCFGAREV